jgi:hypothetical protein
MRLGRTGRRQESPPTSSLARLGSTMALAVVVLVGCSSGSAQDSRIDEARDSGLPDQLAAKQATRTVERFFPSTATPSAPKPPPAALGSLVITFGFRPDGTPDGSYESVPAGVGTAYAAAEMSSLSAGQVVRAVVIDGWGNEIARPEVTIDPGAADRWLALPIALPAEVAPGEYGVFVFVDDRPLGSLAFGVTGPGTSAQLLPELPANPQVRSTLPPPGMASTEVSPTPSVVPTT